MCRTLRISIVTGLVILSNVFGGSRVVLADRGKPVAVRWWGQAMVSVETYWNLRIVVDPYATRIGYDDPQAGGDLVLITHEHADHNNAELIGGNPVVVRGLDAEGNVRPVHHVLDRPPNADRPTWKGVRTPSTRSKHAAVVTTIPSWHDDEQGQERGANTMFLIEVDGVRIVHCGDLGQRELTDDQLRMMSPVDLLLIPVGGTYTVDGGQAAHIVRQVKPRIVVPIHYKTAVLTFNLAPVQPFLDALGSDHKVVRPVGNTVAIRAFKPRRGAPAKVVVAKFRPWVMPNELADSFSRKDAASRASQAVFAELSANQMNFRPSNGTHTPRWNAEHMMGRELGFFSQIYAQIDPAVAHIDLNPNQMPPDYVAAHPNWSGEEEARQMERITAFSRRFAYLLDGLDLDQKAPGSRWTPRGLLEQMERHYQGHTANVKKKFELPDWPKE